MPCGVVSAAPEDETREILTQKGIASYFSLLLGSPLGKSENIMKFLKQYRINAGSTVMIGDSLTDYLGDSARTGMISFSSHAGTHLDLPPHVCQESSGVLFPV